MDTQKIPIMGEKLIDAVGEELTPQQRHTLRQRARQYEQHLRQAQTADPDIGPTGFMLGMIERRLDRIESNSKDSTQMLLGIIEKCQVHRDVRLRRLVWADIGLAAVVGALLVGGRDMALAVVRGIWSKLG